jgi:hypothetical protein
MALGAVLLGAPSAFSQGACESFKWDVAREHALFLGAAVPLVAGVKEDGAPELELGRLYELELSPVGDVTFAVPPSQKKPAALEIAHGGMARFRVPRAGRYRVSLGDRAWVDVSAKKKLLSPADFSGAEGCTAPRKVVAYDSPEGEEMTLELSGASDAHVRVTLTMAPAPAK